MEGTQSLRRGLGAAIVLLAFWATQVVAQSTTGRISGTVSDTQGGVLPGVTVTLTQDRTGLTRTALTDQTGGYVMVSLPVGSYAVSAELSGFKKAVKTGFTLVADGRVTADFTLGVGDIN